MEEKKKFQSIFAQIKEQHKLNQGNDVKKNKNSDILVVDAMNLFIASWSVVPTMNDNGIHVGGISGFLLKLGYAIKLLRPTRVIVVFDGKGGSLRRKEIYPDYKANRAMTDRVNRTYTDTVDPQSEKEEMVRQMIKLVDFLRELPISIVCIDHIEADDAIAYIATQMYKESRVTIMSADKDFLQLVNTRVNVYSHIKKKIYATQDVISEYGIHPTNFVFFRCLAGDKSDNIGGVRGFALTTTKKCFPMLADDREISVADMLLYAKERINEKKAYASVVENGDILSRNYSLMQLKEPIFSTNLQQVVESSVGKIHDYNKFTLIQKMTAYGMHNTIQNFHVWLQEVFWPLSVMAKSE